MSVENKLGWSASSHSQAEGCVHRRFSEICHTGRQDWIAVRDKSQQLTYGELEGRANFLAIALQQQQVRVGDVVALYMSRSADMIVAMLAILKCGAAYLPLELSNPAQRNLLYLREAEVGLILTDRDCSELLEGGVQALQVDAPELMGTAALPPDIPLNADALAYIMFTSGSTGKPKGVLIPHRGISRLVENCSFVDIRPDDRFLQVSPVSFDASTFEIWAPLLNGATLVIYQSDAFDPNLFKQDISQHQITVLWLTAALFHLIADRFIDALKPMLVLLAGGDVLNVGYCNKVLDTLDGIRLINGYGPTENTTFTCCHTMDKSNRPVQSVPIGRSIRGTEVYLVDEHLVEVADGDVGELLAGGDGVALGYLKDPDNSAFVRSPGKGLLYRTGDLARRNAQGEYEFVGRKDNLVKIRGFRVSLEEIRTRLMELDGVREAAVLLQKDRDPPLLIAHLLITDDALTGTGIKKALAAVCPAYMIPDRIELSKDLPISRNGKIESRKLVT